MPDIDIQRIARLLAMLSSDSEGERHNAADALGRLLKASGIDLVSLATQMLARGNPHTRGMLDMLDDCLASFRTREDYRYWTAAQFAASEEQHRIREEREHQAEVAAMQRDIDNFRDEVARCNAASLDAFAAKADKQRAELAREIALMPLEMQVTKERYAGERQRINANIERTREASVSQARGELPPRRAPSQRERELAALKSQRTRLENAAARARTAFELRYQQSAEYAALESLRAQLRVLKGLIDRAARGEAVELPDGFDDNTQRPLIRRPS